VRCSHEQGEATQEGGCMKPLPIAIALALAAAAPIVLADGDKIRARLIGYSEVPSVSSAARGDFEARISRDEQFIDYELSYRGLQGTVTQSHIHFGQRHTAGGIVVWLCQTGTNPSPVPATPTCPPSTATGVTVSGTIRASDVVAAPAAQQIAAGELAEVIAAIRAGAAYVNVHSNLSPAGEIRGQIGDRGRSGHQHD
jgi:hypothetical protein